MVVPVNFTSLFTMQQQQPSKKFDHNLSGKSCFKINAVYTFQDLIAMAPSLTQRILSQAPTLKHVQNLYNLFCAFFGTFGVVSSTGQFIFTTFIKHEGQDAGRRLLPCALFATFSHFRRSIVFSFPTLVTKIYAHFALYLLLQASDLTDAVSIELPCGKILPEGKERSNELVTADLVYKDKTQKTYLIALQYINQSDVEIPIEFSQQLQQEGNRGPVVVEFDMETLKPLKLSMIKSESDAAEQHIEVRVSKTVEDCILLQKDEAKSFYHPILLVNADRHYLVIVSQWCYYNTEPEFGKTPSMEDFQFYHPFVAPIPPPPVPPQAAVSSAVTPVLISSQEEGEENLIDGEEDSQLLNSPSTTQLYGRRNYRRELKPMNKLKTYLRKHYGYPKYSRAVGYVQQEMIQSFTVTEVDVAQLKKYKLQSTCKGQCRPLYHQEVHLVNDIIIFETCDCESDPPCKHCCASILTFYSKKAAEAGEPPFLQDSPVQTARRARWAPARAIRQMEEEEEEEEIPRRRQTARRTAPWKRRRSHEFE